MCIRDSYNGADTFTFTASDGELTSDAATVNINIAPINDIPTASAQSASGNEDAAQTITLAGNDVDGDALTYIINSNPSHGTLSGGTSFLNFDGNNDYVDLGDVTFLDGLNNFTLSAWVKLDVLPSGRAMIL